MLDNKVFETLAAVTGDHLVSIYLTTSTVGREQEDRIAFGNALRQAQDQLTDRFGLRPDQAKQYLQPARQLADDYDFWTQQTHGLAVFVGSDFFRHYHLPLAVTNDVTVADRFYLSPAIPSVDDNKEIYLLTLSRGVNKLFLLDRRQIQAIDTTGIIPENMEKALLLDDPNAQLQRAGGQRTGQTGVYFGHGAGKDQENEHLKEYFDVIDRGVRTLLKNDTRPLLLAGVDELIPIYRAANGYNHLVEEVHIAGNVDNMTATELREKAWSVVGDRFDQQRDRDYELYSVNSSRGETSDDISVIVPAALNGRVAVLWAKADHKVYGRYDQRTNGVEITNPDQGAELHNMAAVAARQSGARVYVVPPNDLPSGDSDICAILRYAVDSPTKTLN